MANEKRRLIDAKALWEYVKTTPISAATRTTIMCLLDIAPTVDAVEVVHGQWEIDGVYNRCSVCNRLTLMPYLKGLPQFSYCPNCGAKMRGSEE